jgi:hypothetical protein
VILKFLVFSQAVGSVPDVLLLLVYPVYLSYLICLCCVVVQCLLRGLKLLLELWLQLGQEFEGDYLQWVYLGCRQKKGWRDGMWGWEQ